MSRGKRFESARRLSLFGLDKPNRRLMPWLPLTVESPLIPLSEFPRTHPLPTQVNEVFSQKRRDWLRPLRTAVVNVGHTGNCIGLKNNLGWLKGR
jgi:hypothetical protein